MNDPGRDDHRRRERRVQIPVHEGHDLLGEGGEFREGRPDLDVAPEAAPARLDRPAPGDLVAGGAGAFAPPASSNNLSILDSMPDIFS